MVDRVPERMAELDDAAWLALSAVVERFEAAWQTQGEAALVDFLPAAEDPGRRQVLLELIKIDQENRWRTDQRPLVESYLQQWPELAGSDEIVVELLAAECLTRAAFDQPVQQAELEQRFPRFAARIDLAEIQEQVYRETVSTGPDTADAWGELSDTMADLGESVTLETFLGRLIAARLMTAEAVEQCLAGLSEQERPGDGWELARRLVQSGKLTTYQAQTLCRGRDDPLVLGNYVILQPLGHGGMGQVFKAVHRRMDRIVAVKILSPELGRTPQSLRRFQQEVKAAARLSHPNIVIAYDADEADGKPFLVMEYVSGIDLATLVRGQGPVPPSLALDCVLQAARGLQYAHEQGVVHRDVKPANLVLSVVRRPLSVAANDRTITADCGQLTTDHAQLTILKILDMGLAHLDSADAAQDELTGAGQLMGTVDFMAPEQAIDAHQADGRADIYSLGATLWFLLTGQSMYTGRTTAGKLLEHQTGSIPSLAGVLPDLPPPLEAVFRRMVAKRPEERYQTMAELIADLEPLRGSVADLSAAAAATPQAGPLAELAITEALAAPQVATASEPSASRSSRVSDPADRRSPASAPNRGQPAAATARRPPWRRDRRKLAVAVAGGLLLISLAIWVVIRDKHGQEVGRVRLPKGGSVTHEPDTLSPRPGTPAEDVGPDRRTGSGGGEGRPSSPRPGTPGRGAGGEGPWNLPPDAPPPAIAPFDAAQAKEHQEAWAKYLGVPAEIENSIGMIFVLIPPGEFDMGTSGAEVAAILEQAEVEKWPDWLGMNLPAEAPQHRVRITKPFYLGSCEVTQQAYQRVVGGNPSRFMGDPQQPVDSVSWDEATAFCRNLSEQPDEQAVGAEYRLPTEAQWEYACRSGTTTRFSWGDRDGDFKEYAWLGPNSGDKTHPAGQKTPNAWGLHDMHGNVAEWCQDWFGGQYYTTSNVVDPDGPPTGESRMFRGGSWYHTPYACRSSWRAWFRPDHRHPFRGFRVARSLGDPEGGSAANAAVLDAARVTPQPDPPAQAAPGTSPPFDAPEKVAQGKVAWNLPLDAPPPAIAPFDAAQAKEHQEAWAKYLRVPVEMENSIGMKFMLIPPGEFDMGSTDAEVAELQRQGIAAKQKAGYILRLAAQTPRHRVRITRPFWLGGHEVTRGQFRRFVGDCGYRTEAEEDGKGGYGLVDGQPKQDPRFYWDADLGFEQTDDHPLVNVSWNDVTAFCTWLSEKEGETSQLPTEAQWEYACRAGTTTLWYSGDEAGAALDEHAWFEVNAEHQTHPVGQKSPNAWGLFDMHGNVWEWCSDWFDAEYYASSPVNDPTGPSAGLHRVYRGGGWASEACECRTSYRFYLPSFARNWTRGFRIARTVQLADPR